MTSKTWVLFDRDADTHMGYDNVFGDKLSASFKMHKSGLSSGVETVTINNGKLSVSVLPGRGMNIWKAFYNGDSDNVEEIGWKSPVRGPVNPSFVPVMAPDGLGWLEGFDELLARCGLESNGAPEFDGKGQLKYPLHGKISNKPAYKLELMIDEDEGRISLVGWVEETRLHHIKVRMKSTISMVFNKSGFDIEDEITNISTSPAEIQMLYHMNFGSPLLEEGAEVVAPFKEIVPRTDHAASDIDGWKTCLGETLGYEEQVYFATLHSDADGNSATLLKNASGDRGAYLKFNTSQLPCMTVWKNTTTAEDGYVTGIEPGTNYPNPRTFEGENDRVIKLEGNGSTTLSLSFEYCVDQASVAAAESSIKELQAEPEITHRKPLPKWCAE